MESDPEFKGNSTSPKKRNVKKTKKKTGRAYCTGDIRSLITTGEEKKTSKPIHPYICTNILHKTYYTALVNTVFVAHSGKQGRLHNNLNRAGTSNLVNKQTVFKNKLYTIFKMVVSNLFYLFL